MSTYSDRILVRMKELGLSQGEVAKATGAARSTVHGWLNNVAQPSGQRLLLLATTLKTTAEWILNGESPTQSQTLGTMTQSQSGQSQQGFYGAEVIGWAEGDPVPEGYVAVDYYDEIHVSAGDGYLNSEQYTPRKYLLSLDLIKECDVDSSQAQVIPVHGDSMAPELKDGQLISIDRSAKRIIDSEIYAFCVDGHTKIKYLFNWNDEGKGGFKAVSRNEDKLRFPDEYYSPARIEAEKVYVIGQYWWKQESKKVRR